MRKSIPKKALIILSTGKVAARDLWDTNGISLIDDFTEGEIIEVGHNLDNTFRFDQAIKIKLRFTTCIIKIERIGVPAPTDLFLMPNLKNNLEAKI